MMKESLNAVLINKSAAAYGEQPVYRMVFQTPKGICSFRVSADAYNAGRIGQKGMLTYSSNRMESFGTIRKSFSQTVTERSWLRLQA